MKTLCKLFGHKFRYYLTSDLQLRRNFRCCLRCARMEEYRDVPAFGKGWYSLVQRTKGGAKIFLKELQM